MLKLKKMTSVYDMKVFTDAGDYFGDVEEAIVTMTKVLVGELELLETLLFQEYLVEQRVLSYLTG